MIFDDLISLYADMDAAYSAVAEAAGFHCRGCEDSCCLTRFYHHTFIEWAFLREGIDRLPEAGRLAAEQNARLVISEMAAADAGGRTFRKMCPLNVDGLCGVYAQRPMICRLHGLAHRFTPPVPGRPPVEGPGCHMFDAVCGDAPAAVMDRTVFYTRMAQLEQAFRKERGYDGRMRMTVAEMVLSAPE